MPDPIFNIPVYLDYDETLPIGKARIDAGGVLHLEVTSEKLVTTIKERIIGDLIRCFSVGVGYVTETETVQKADPAIAQELITKSLEGN